MSHRAVFISNVQCVRLAAKQHTHKMCCYRSPLGFDCSFKTLST